MPGKAKIPRAHNAPGSAVGKQRQSFYQNAFERVSLAINQGFYLEAITLIESMISDRLESRLTTICGSNVSFENLGSLIEKIGKHEKDERLRCLVTQDLFQWKALRNKSIHELVKIGEGDTSTWESRSEQLPLIAGEGFKLLRKIAGRVQIIQESDQRKRNRGE